MSPQLTALSAFDGMPVEGDWTLRIADEATIDTGRLHDWFLCLDTEPAPGHVSVERGLPRVSLCRTAY